ncbi:MAG: cytochrome-c oxidase [Rhizobiaceae bacterium]|jgi:cytochrome c oxidase subunit 3|nr:cytochrome-c oxidase [Rhizobiaceae bacterium]
MSIVLGFMAVVVGIAAWWLSQQRLMAKPWLETGNVDAYPRTESGSMPPAKIGMGVFLAVVGSLFALFTSAYFMRMGFTDWRSLPVPRILWLNTFILVLSSVALHCAVLAARNRRDDLVRLALVTGGMTAFAFLIGQWLAWRELTASGHFLTANPANSFFYLITGMHGLHILGGLVGLGTVTARAWRGAAADRLRLGVELCAMYWHFLLFVWLFVFVILAGWAEGFIEICRALLT